MIRPGVLVAGNIVADTLVRHGDQPVWGGTQWVESIVTQEGGNGASTACALATLGVFTRLLGETGDDAAGQFVHARVEAMGVDVSCIVISDLPTAVTVGLIALDAQRALFHCPGVSTVAFEGEVEFDEGHLRDIRHFHLANPYGLTHMRRRAPDWLRRARQAGLSTSLDTAWDSQGEWSSVLAPCLPHLDILFVNQTEAAMFAERGLQLQVPCVVKKLGAQGCAVNGAHVPGYRVDAVDTTGAGDCFVGGFLAARMRGASLMEAAAFANAAGALSTTAIGSITALRNYDDTVSWMRSM